MANVGTPMWQPPQTPDTLAIRPLTKGVVTEGSSVLAELGSALRASGYEVTLRGLKRQGGWTPAMIIGGKSVPVPMVFGNSADRAERRLGEQVQEMVNLFKADGSSVGIVITNRALYTVDQTVGYKPVYWKKAYTIVSTTSNTAVFAGNLITDLITSGDYLYDDSEYYLISNISYDAGTDKTTILVNRNWVVAPTGDIHFIKPFTTPAEDIISWTIGRNKLYFVDGYTPMVFKFDGEFVSGFVMQDTSTPPSAILWTAKSIVNFKDRLFFLNTVEGSSMGQVQQRVRWSEVLNWETSAAANYQDLVAKPGVGVSLAVNGDIIMAFTEDALYVGEETGSVDIPYAFREVQTGGAVPTGPRAVAPMPNGMLFVASDDVYFFTNPKDTGPQLTRVGSSVASSLLDSAVDQRAIIAKTDVLNSRVMILTSTATGQTLELWFWSYKPNAWSSADSVDIRSLSITDYTQQIHFDDVDPSWTIENNPYAELPISVLQGQISPLTVYAFDVYGNLLKYDPEATQHLLPDGGGAMAAKAIESVLETQDMDFGLPDTDKSVMSLGLRLVDDPNSTRTVAVKFRVEGSTNRGKTWRYLGTLRIDADDDEDAITFRMTGPTIRFRISTGSVSYGTTAACAPWTILELTSRVRARGAEQQRGTLRVS